MEWRSVHVYYYDPDKDALILEAVRPLFDRLVGHVDSTSFVRHWRRGPHLRLNVHTDTDTFNGMVRPAVAEIVGGFLARRPSTWQVDLERELATHRRLAELESDSGPLAPWCPDNSVQLASYAWRDEVLGNRTTAALLADFYAGTTQLTFRMIERASGSARFALAFDLMIATAAALSGRDLTNSFVSFRSHAEAFLCGWPEGVGMRPAWDDHYARNADHLVQRVRAVVSTVEGTAQGVPFVGDWIAVARPYRQHAEALVADGTVTLPTSGVPKPDGNPLDASPFHRRLYSSARWPETQRSPSFILYRLMLNFLYLNLTRLGISPGQRFLLCHLAANAVEDTYGISAFELVK